jgi:uncharacterized DUF497 family protein
MRPTHRHFYWDEAKARSNYRKHGVLFDHALMAIDDPLAIARQDDPHDAADERWITLGEAGGTLLHIMHTLEELDDRTVCGRILSARHPTPDERRQYENGTYRIQEADMINKSNPDQWIRGRFYQEGMVSIGPIHVDRDLVAPLAHLSKRRGASTSTIANELMRRALDIEPSGAGAETTKAQTVV